MRKIILILSLVCGSGFLSAQTPVFLNDVSANEPSAPQVGDIVPDSIIFSLSSADPVELTGPSAAAGRGFRLPELEEVSYSDFPNEIVATLYHAPW